MSLYAYGKYAYGTRLRWSVGRRRRNQETETVKLRLQFPANSTSECVDVVVANERQANPPISQQPTNEWLIFRTHRPNFSRRVWRVQFVRMWGTIWAAHRIDLTANGQVNSQTSDESFGLCWYSSIMSLTSGSHKWFVSHEWCAFFVWLHCDSSTQWGVVLCLCVWLSNFAWFYRQV